MNVLSNNQKATAWTLAAIGAVVFVAMGASKILALDVQVELFLAWGYPLWFMYVVGFVEMAGAMLLLAPRSAFWGASALMAVMAGAFVTHIVHAQFLFALAPVVLGALLGTVAYLRRPDKLDEVVGASDAVHG